MRQFLHLKHDGRAFERFMNDFCVCFNACGGYAVNTYYPADFHISTKDFSAWVDVKEMHTANNHIFSLKYYDTNSRFREQINFLHKMQVAGHFAIVAIWLPHWRELKAKAPFIFFDGSLLYKTAANSKFGNQRVNICADYAKVFNLYGLLQKAPNFERFFQNIPIDRRPYIYHSFPSITNYIDPKYTAWKIGGAEHD